MKKIISIITLLSLLLSSIPSVLTAAFAEGTETSPEKWLITLDDKYCTDESKKKRYRMYLLDTEETASGTNYYCYTVNSFSNLQFDVNGAATAQYNPNVEGNIAWWVNSELAESDSPDYMKMSNDSFEKHPSYAHTVPAEIRSYITEHTFEVEKGADIAAAYSVTAKMALLSLSEFYEYQNHFEYKSGSGYVRLRSPDPNAAASTPASMCYASDTGAVYAIKYYSLGLIRPCFWLNGEFFENVKLDVENTGEEVRKLLKQNYTKSQLAEVGYSEYELGLLGYDIDESIYVTEVKLTEDKLSLPGYTLTAKAVGTDKLNTDLIEYKWQYSSDNFVWTDTTGGEDGSYEIENKTANGYVRAVCVVKGSKSGRGVYSDSVKIGAALPSYTTGNPGVESEAPEEYLVVMENSSQTFSLLDVEETESSAQYFCYANFATGNMAWWSASEDAVTGTKFDPSDSSNIAYWMNDETNGMLASSPIALGNGNFANSVTIDSNIKQYAVTHDWLTEAGSTVYGDVDNDYVVYSKFALLSYNEYVKYKDRIGYGACAIGYIRMRTPRKSGTLSSTRGTCFAVKSGSFNTAGSFSNHYIRPCFYLGYNFFENVKIDTSKSGRAVKAVLAKYYTDSQLEKAGYTSDEISDIKQGEELQKGTYSIEFANAPTYIVNMDSAGFNISIESSVTAYFDVSYTVDGETITNTHTVSADTPYTVFVPLADIKYGKHLVNASIICNGITLCRKEQYISVVKEYTAKSVDALARVGVNLNTINESALKLLQDIGIKKVRYSISWNSYEKPKGVYDTALADEKMALLEKYGLSPILTLAYTNIYYTSDERAPYTAEQLEGFAAYAADLAQRYPQVRAFSVWNEPNIGFWKPEANVIEYTNLVKETSKAIKAVKPDAVINAGVLAKQDGMTFGRQMMELGTARYVDSVSFHPYSFPREADALFDSDVSEYSSLCDDFGGWADYRITEIGWPTHQSSVGVTEDVSARSLVKAAVKSDDAGIEEMYWYCYVNPGDDATYSEDNFGVLNSDLSAKKGYPALAQFMNAIGGKEYLGKLELGENSVGYLYNDSGNLVMAAWSKDDSEAVNLPLEDVSKIEDLYGNELDLSDTVTLTKEPMYIYGEGHSIAAEAVYNAAAVYCEKAEIAAPEISVSSETVLSQIDALYLKASEAADTTRMEDISNAAERLIRLYAYLENDVVSSYEIQTDLSTVDFSGSLVYSNKILKRAEKYLNKAEFLAENNGADAAIKACDIIAGKLKAAAEALAALETPDGTKDIRILTDPSVVNGSGEFDIGIDIYNKEDTVKADVSVYDADGNLQWHRGDADIEKETTVSLEAEISTKNLADGEYFYWIVITEKGNEIARQGIKAVVVNDSVTAYESEKGVYTAEITSGNGDAKSARVFVAVYNADGIISVDFEDVYLNGNTVSVQLEGESISNTGNIAKVMLWNTDGVEPVCSSSNIN